MSERPQLPDEHHEVERTAMPFRAHLVELRGRLLRATIGVTIGFFVAWTFHVELFELLSAPVRSAMADNGLFAIKALQITESISVYMRIALVGGVFLASPWVFWQAWAFVAPGLLRSEKRLAVPILASSVAFFLAGAAFCYFVVLPFMTDFLIKMTIEADGLTLEPTLASTTSYATWLLLAFGLVFELPVFMYFLAALGLVTARGLFSFYRYWIVIASIIGALLTPTPDPLNQMLMSGPLIVLYGVGTGIAWFVERDRDRGARLPLRGALALALLLLLAGFVGVQSKGAGSRDPLADVPRDALQLVGVHVPAIERLRQQVGESGTRGGLGVLAALPALGLEASESHVFIVRMASGMALIVPSKDAEAVPARLSRARRSSLLRQAGGPSVQLRLPGEERLWRVTAPQPDVLWIGHDDVLAALEATRFGASAAMADDVHFAAMIEELRAGGPLWALTLQPLGVAGWLPNGALAERVDRASAVLAADGGRLRLRLIGQSEADARSLRDRVAVWAADLRGASDVGAPPPDDRLELLTRRLAAVASLIGRVGESAARALPDGSSDQIALLAASHDANRLGRELRGVAPAPPPTTPSALEGMFLPPSILEASVRGHALTLQVEGQAPALIAGLLAAAKTAVDAGAFAQPSPEGAAGAEGKVDGGARDATAGATDDATPAPTYIEPAPTPPPGRLQPAAPGRPEVMAPTPMLTR